MSVSPEIRAFDSRALAQVLTQHATLMERFKAAAEEGRVRAVHQANRNLTVVEDAEVLHMIRATGAKLQAHEVDPESGGGD